MAYWTKPELNPVMIPTAIDVAWSAGVYEGEGHVRHRKNAAALAQVTQKDPEILYKLRDWFGGSVRFARCKTIAADKQCYCWLACGDHARLFIALIYPFLSSRRRIQVDNTEALTFLRGESPEGKSHEELVEYLKVYSKTRYKRILSPEKQAIKNKYEHDRVGYKNALRRNRRAAQKLTLVA